MSKIDKLIERLKSKPKDFSWDEMLKVFKAFWLRTNFAGKDWWFKKEICK